MEKNQNPKTAIECMKALDEQQKHNEEYFAPVEIRGEDYFELGGMKFSRDVKLEDAIKVLEEKGIHTANLFMNDVAFEKITEEESLQDIIDSCDTSIKAPRFGR